MLNIAYIFLLKHIFQSLKPWQYPNSKETFTVKAKTPLKTPERSDAICSMLGGPSPTIRSMEGFRSLGRTRVFGVWV